MGWVKRGANMAKVLLYYAHPGHKYSRANAALAEAAQAVAGSTGDLSFVDLYARYPRHNIKVDAEQDNLRAHDVILFQFPMFWYSTPSIIKEWQDLVLEHGFAYGAGGTALKGKRMMLAITTSGPEEAYSPQGYQNHTLRTFLSPLQQTAHLCNMRFLAPYVLYGALKSSLSEGIRPHAEGYRKLLHALIEDRLDEAAAEQAETLHHDTLPLIEKA